MSTPAATSNCTVVRAKTGARATYAAFIAMGASGASWAARIPQIRSGLQLSSAGLGLVLLCVAVGSLIALPLAGVIVHRFTSRSTVATMAVLFAIGLSVACIGYHAGVVPVAIGFLVLGFANGAWDVGMNVQGAIVEFLSVRPDLALHCGPGSTSNQPNARTVPARVRCAVSNSPPSRVPCANPSAGNTYSASRPNRGPSASTLKKYDRSAHL